MISDQIKPSGQVTFILTDANGKVKQTQKANLVVDAGKDFLASALLNSSTSPFTHMALGTGTTAAAATDTTLHTELTRIAFTSHSVTTNVASMSTTYGAGVGTGAITEAGIFNAATAGTMLSRVVFSVINKASTDTLTINWSVTIN